MSNEQTIRRKIADINAAIESGASSITLDGVTVSLNLAQLREERRRLELELPEKRLKRPRVYRFRV